MGVSGTLLGTRRVAPFSITLTPPHGLRKSYINCKIPKIVNRSSNPVVGFHYLCSRPSALRCRGDGGSRVYALSANNPNRQEEPSSKDKGKAIKVGSLILLSSLAAMCILPTLAAFATSGFDKVAKAGASAAVVGWRKPTTIFSTELLSAAWSGLLAGCLHTLSGPDHLAALAPLSIGRTKVESAIVGALWGCGHDAGQVMFGIVFLLLKDRLHIEIVRAWGTRVVGMTLLVIGALGIKEASEVPTPCVSLDGGECDETMASPTETVTGGKKKIGLATFATGIVHGLQPDALMVILPALALPSRLAGSAYLLSFLCGTVIAMGSYTVFIGSCSEALKTRIPRITEKLTWASSIIAISFGVAILCSQLFGFSLF